MTSRRKSTGRTSWLKRRVRASAAIIALVLGFAGAADPLAACGPGPVPKQKIPPPPTLCPTWDCDQCSGSPCYVKSGAFKTTVEDLNIPTPGFPLVISRYYESARPYDGPLGRGWTLNLPVRLFYTTYMFSAPSTYLKEADITMPNGERFRFTENTGGTTYTAPPYRHDTLIKNGDGTFDLTIQKSRAKYRFSSVGAMTSMTDDKGNALNLTYDGNGRLQSVADGAGSGRSFTVTWGPDGRISSVQDSGGRVVQYGYTNGNLTSVTDVAGRITTYSYQLTGSGWLLSGAVDPWSRQTISVTYDLPSCHASSISAGGESFDYIYNPNGVPNRTDKTRADLDGSWFFYFTPEGWITDRIRVYGSTGSGGPTYHTDYNPDGSIQQTIDEVGVKTFYTYNAQGHLLTVTRDYQGPNAIRYDYAYDPNFLDRVTSITPVNPGTGVRNPDWQMWKYDYYQAGSPSPGSLFHVYRVKSTPLNPPYATDTLATYVYNAKGQVTQHTDAWSHTTDYTYDASFNLWKVKGPANNDGGTRPETIYGYDGLGRVTSVTDPLNHATTYQYDNLNRVTSVTLPKPTTSSTLNFTTTYDYDDFDSPTGLIFTTVTDPNGKITKQGYDQFGRLIRAIDAQNQVTVYAYTNGLMTSITDANGNLTTYEYDRLGRWLTTINHPTGAWEGYIYYIDGTLDTHTTGDGWRQNHYDNLKRVYR